MGRERGGAEFDPPNLLGKGWGGGVVKYCQP